MIHEQDMHDTNYGKYIQLVVKGGNTKTLMSYFYEQLSKEDTRRAIEHYRNLKENGAEVYWLEGRKIDPYTYLDGDKDNRCDFCNEKMAYEYGRGYVCNNINCMSVAYKFVEDLNNMGIGSLEDIWQDDIDWVDEENIMGDVEGDMNILNDTFWADIDEEGIGESIHEGEFGESESFEDLDDFNDIIALEDLEWLDEDYSDDIDWEDGLESMDGPKNDKDIDGSIEDTDWKEDEYYNEEEEGIDWVKELNNADNDLENSGEVKWVDIKYDKSAEENIIDKDETDIKVEDIKKK